MSSCRGCLSENVRVFFDLGNMPLAGGFLNQPPESTEDEATYPLAISVCESCGLVQIVDPVDPSILFSDYSFMTGTIPGLVRHFDDYADWIVERYAPATAIEFGCNDGTLVEALARRGVKALGIDLAENIVELGQAEGRNIVCGAFSPAAVEELLNGFSGKVDFVTGSNVFAHNADPDGILEASSAVLASDGVLCLEVMYAGALLDDLQWDTLYHEHLTFYSLSTITPLLERHGFEAIDAEIVPMHGGSLRVSASSAGSRAVSPSVAELMERENAIGITSEATWDRFATESQRRIEIFGSTMRDLGEEREIWAYGAAGKATMWVNACDMTFLTAVVDASPLRHGKFMPGTHTPIVSPEAFRDANPDYVFASAWNYLDAIRANEPAYEGAWVVPLPEMRIY